MMVMAVFIPGILLSGRYPIITRLFGAPLAMRKCGDMHGDACCVTLCVVFAGGDLCCLD